MAVAFDTAGPSSAGAGSTSSSTLAWTHPAGAVANRVILVGVSLDSPADGGQTMAATCAGVTMTSLAKVHSNNGTQGYLQVWGLTGVGTGTLAISVTVTGGAPGDLEGGSLSFSGAGGFGTPATAASSSNTATVVLATNTNGNLIAGFAAAGDVFNSATSPATSRFINNNVAGAGNATGNAAGATSPATGSSVTMAWSNNTAPYAAVAVEVTPALLTASDPRYAQPGRTWLRNFRNPQYRNQFTPGPVMTTASPGTATASAAALNPTVVTVSAAAAQPAYPGATWRKHFQSPQQQQLSGPPPLAWATAGLASATATANPVTVARYITGLAGSPSSGYFGGADGQPRLYYAAVPWGLPANAGRWNSGNWQSDFDTYFADIAAQGMTAAEMHPFGHSHTGCNNDLGNTWDSVSPWTTLPTLNSTFWQRIDYLLNSALANNITVLLVLNMQCDMGVDAFAGTGVFNGVSAANVQTACQNIAARYASQPNLIFFQGDDYNNDDDTRMQAMVDGLHAGGYTGPTGVEEYSSGTTSRRDLSGSPTGTPFVFGGANATFNWCYYYAQTYFAVEQAYKENNQIPVVWGDGFYVGGGAGEPADTHLMRNFVWWALASGARGVSMGSESILNWQSTAFADITTNQKWYSTSAQAVFTAFTSLTGWQNLLPDLNSTLVVAGRGTRSGYSASNFQAANLGTDNYVAASRTPDGSLAVIYCAVAMSITIDQTKIGAGYTATWIDPANGSTQAATPGTTYSSSPLGSNSAGDPDWVLALQGPPVVTLPAPQALPGRTWLQRFHHQQQPLAAAPATTTTSAAAGLASASAIALGQDNGSDLASVAPNAGNAAATGTSLGQDTGADLASVAPNASTATGTGTARGFDTGDMLPGVAYPPAQAYPGAPWREHFQHPQQPVPPAPFNVYPATATATGAALGQDNGNDLASVLPNAGNAAGTGTSLGQDQGADIAAVTVNAGAASGTGTALGASTAVPAPPPQAAYPGSTWRKFFQHPQQPAAFTAPPAATNASAGLATATGTSLGQDTGADLASVAPNATVAAATGTGQAAAASLADTGGTASATGTGQNPAAGVAATPATATGTGSALDATVTATATAPPPLTQILPGRTWLRQYRHLQLPLPPPPFVPPALQNATSAATVSELAGVGAAVYAPGTGTVYGPAYGPVYAPDPAPRGPQVSDPARSSPAVSDG